MSEEQTPETPPEAAPETPAPEPEGPPDYFANAMAACDGEEAPPEAPEPPPEAGEPAEATTEPEAEASEGTTEEKPVSDAWAAVTKRERELTKQGDDLRATETAFIEREAAVKATEDAQSADLEIVRMMRDPNSDPIAVFRHFGRDWQTFLTAAMNGGVQSQQADLSPLEEKLAAQAKEFEDYKAQQATASQSRKEADAKAGMTEMVTGEDSDRWELLKNFPDYQGEMIAYARAAFEKTPDVALTWEPVADRLGEHLLADAKKHVQSAKVRALYGAPSEKPSPADSQPRIATQGTGSAPVPPAAPTQTLTNATAAEISSRDGHTDFSPEACIERALAVLSD